MTRWTHALPLMPAALVGVLPAESAAAPESAAAGFELKLATTGLPAVQNLKNPDKQVQGLAPKATNDVVAFDAIAGDTVRIAPVGPKREFKGKGVAFDVLAEIVEERKEKCKKIEERRPYSEEHEPKGPMLSLGAQVKLQVEVVYKQLPAEQYTGTFDAPVELRLKDSASVRVKLVFNPDDVVFVERGPTEAEMAEYVRPEVERLRRERPTYRDPRSANERVEPGELGALVIGVKMTREK